MAGKRESCAIQRTSVMQRFLGGVFKCWRNNRVHPITSQDVVVGPTKLEENVEVENRIIMEGYLFKRASNIFKTWNRRWFIIRNNQLVYKKKFKRSPTVVMEDLQLCTVKQYENNGRHFCFQVVSPTKTCMLQAVSEKKRQAWITAIQNSTANTDNGKDKSEMLDRKVSSCSGSLVLDHKVLDLSVQQKQLRSSSESLTLRDSQTGYKASESFDCRYTVGTLLGQGGFAAVHDGIRKADGKEVAIKYVRKDTSCRFITIPGETDSLPVEVALLQMVSKPPRCRYVLELLEWFNMPEHYLLILEQPIPCMDLNEYRRGDSLPESVAKIIMWQVVLAARHCRDRGVLHRDIKEENLIINAETLEVKLIDFGCGDLLISTPYKKFSGTPLYSPPEWMKKGKYCGCPATVWSLGILLFLLVCGELPFCSRSEIVKGRLSFAPDVSLYQQPPLPEIQMTKIPHLNTWKETQQPYYIDKGPAFLQQSFNSFNQCGHNKS